ncbi:MAG: adenylate/guanylate cyclase domain-containing protein [Candidatus Marinimicrobia bacterium]|nr:adenylate/guanylate cyclase domain-containing protein [Candidatus Neomarinimicrobiota bacterium]
MSNLVQRFKYPGDQAIVNKLANHIETSNESELFHIDVYSLANQWNVSKKDLLELFIRGLHEGIFRMEWEYHCPRCGGIANETLFIHEAKSINCCDICKIEFSNKLDVNIEVFFSIHPEVRNISLEFKDNYLKSNKDNITATKMIRWKNPFSIYGVDIIQNPVFRELMEGEVLAPDQSLELMKCTLLFTDIKGSTQMYNDLGDSRAFQLVREHFRIIFEVIKRSNGIPVKTIGDAVMGAFSNKTEGLKAALEAQKSLIEFYRSKPENEKIEVKIGLNSGTTIIVTLNGKLDYFGSTVNMAARIQSIANPNEIVLPMNIFEDEECNEIISSYAKTITKSKTTFKGLNGEYNVYHIVLN